MLAIRMQRNGRTHLPMYRIIVQESQRHPLSGRVVAEVGNYNPTTKTLVMDKEAVEKYLKNGAKPSSRVALILKKNGIKLPKWYKEEPKKSKKAKHADKLRKNQPKEEAPAAEEAPTQETPAETPAEETPAAE
ncbi:MAG: 30S ribosomal protein S16 [Candidatus Saccharibacteria bacterium]|nr:30S ribosomal protein S16 [Candidatus Saccharibacteria bacterium]